jgi:hypothetical protein
MPLRDQSKYEIVVPGEPKEVTEIRKHILHAFGDLEFVEEGHKYFLHGEELPSVSSVASRFESEFDTVAKATAYAEKNGQTPEYWIDQWKLTNLKATTTGTQVHGYAESLAWMYMGHPENIVDDQKYKYVEDKNWLIPTRPKEESALKFWKEFPKNTYVVLPETKVFNIGNTLKYAGTFDLLVYYKNPKDDSKSGLVIMDWKTNSSIYKEFSRMKQKMLSEPFQNLFDEPYGGYSIQLSLYILALEKIGLNVLGGRIIWLKDDGTYEIVSVPYLKEPFHTIDKSI